MTVTVMWPAEEVLHHGPVVLLTALQSSPSGARGTHFRDMETETSKSSHSSKVSQPTKTTARAGLQVLGPKFASLGTLPTMDDGVAGHVFLSPLKIPSLRPQGEESYFQSKKSAISQAA